MDSGDLGYRADGELYITGRRKDMIKKAGRNLYPQELEEMVGDLPGIRKGCVAAFGVADPTIGTERLVVLAESRDTAPAVVERLHAAVRERVVAALGIPPDTVVVTRPGSILKTSSGKIRRAATRDAYLRGDHLRRRASPRVQWGRLLVGNAGERLRRLAGRGGALLYALYVAAVTLVTLPRSGSPCGSFPEPPSIGSFATGAGRPSRSPAAGSSWRAVTTSARRAFSWRITRVIWTWWPCSRRFQCPSASWRNAS